MHNCISTDRSLSIEIITISLVFLSWGVLVKYLNVFPCRLDRNEFLSK